MIDLKLLRKYPDVVRDSLAKRGEPADIVDEILVLAGECRALRGELEEDQALLNKGSKIVGQMKRLEALHGNSLLLGP